MVKIVELPSGSFRGQAYSHSEPAFDKDGNPTYDKSGKRKQKRIYKSFTGTTKKEVNYMIAKFQADKETKPVNKQCDYEKMTLSEAIDKYIDSRVALSRSPTTIQDYRCIQKYGFIDIMDMPLKKINDTILQESINREARRKSHGNDKGKTISAKRLKNEWGLVSAVLNKYHRRLDFAVELPAVAERVPELIPAKTVLEIVKGTEIELAVLLAAWLSFSMSEVRGLTKSKSISGDNIRIAEVVVDVGGKAHRKEMAKNQCRNRTHRIPPYIRQLIDNVDGDVLVPLSGRAIYHRWIRLLDDNNLSHMTFHDLRHLNASIMALLRIPDKYAQERGGWKTDQIMKRVYTQTFSEEREKVDNVIDEYFGSIAEPEGSEFDKDKYKAWLTLFNRADTRESKKEFLLFMQHDMQHELKKAT